MKIPKLPFSFPLEAFRDFAGKIFSMGRREAIITFSVIVTAVAASIIITAIVMISSGKSSLRNRSDSSVLIYEDGKYISDKKVFISDFILDDDEIEKSLTGFIYSREPMDKWNRAQVEEFWIEPDEIVADHLKQDCDRIIRDIFSDVP